MSSSVWLDTLRDRLRSTITGTQEELAQSCFSSTSREGSSSICFWMPPGHLPREAFWVSPTGRRPQVRPKTHWMEYISRLAWVHLGVPLAELEEVYVEEKELSISALAAFAANWLQVTRRKCMHEGMHRKTYRICGCYRQTCSSHPMPCNLPTDVTLQWWLRCVTFVVADRRAAGQGLAFAAPNLIS